MVFPVYFHLFGLSLHPHPVIEGIAYTTGFGLQWQERRRELRTGEAVSRNLWIAVGALVGAIAGAKLLNWLQSPAEYRAQAATLGWAALLEGKTIVGGILGGWAGVEIAKKLVGERASTGDSWVLPLSVAIAIGRIGCFLTGLSDDTCGTPSTLPWAVDFGDGIHRHPAQLYEIAFLLLQLIPLRWLQSRPHTPGAVFRWFVLGYCSFRFAAEYIKPVERPCLGFSAIQWACLAAVIYCAYNLFTHRHVRRGLDAGPPVSVL